MTLKFELTPDEMMQAVAQYLGYKGLNEQYRPVVELSYDNVEMVYIATMGEPYNGERQQCDLHRPADTRS